MNNFALREVGAEKARKPRKLWDTRRCTATLGARAATL